MEEILTKLKFSQSVKDSFRKEKIYSSTVPLLSRDQLKEVGIETLGEVALLREACKQSFRYDKVASEVSRIMQPLPTSSESCSGRSTPVHLSRRKTLKKRKGLSRQCSEPKSAKVPTFHKKLVVIKYMGPKSPRSFTRRENDVLFRGLLPELPVNASEKTIREEIVKILHNSKEFQLGEFQSDNFEFMDACGKKVTIPVCGLDDQQFDGKTVKQMAGVGGVYIRLTKRVPDRTILISDDSDFEPSIKLNKHQCSNDSDSSFELPSYMLHRGSGPSTSSTSGSSTTPLKTLNLSATSQGSSLNTTPGPEVSLSIAQQITEAASLSITEGRSSTTEPDSSNVITEGSLSIIEGSSIVNTEGSSSITEGLSSITEGSSNITEGSSNITNCSLNTSASGTSCVQDSLSSTNCLGSELLLSDTATAYSNSLLASTAAWSIENIHKRFGFLSIEDITTLYEIAGRNCYKVVDLLENLSLSNLLDLVQEHFIQTCTEESPSLKLSEAHASDEQKAELLLSFYKSSRFRKSACVQVTGSQAVDCGGVRRQFYSDAFEAIAKGHMGIFEGPDKRRITLAIRPSNVVSGLLKNMGIAIAHNLLMDKSGFPFLSPPIYYYLVGQHDVAYTHLEDADVSGQALHVIEMMKSSSTNCLVEDEADEKYIEASLDESGSDLILNVANKDEIIQTIFIHHALHKKKVYLDTFSEGLDEYKIFSLMKMFPTLFKPAFIGEEISSQDVISMIVPSEELENDEHKIQLVSTLFNYLSELSSNGLQKFLALVTGSRFLTPDCILLKFTSKDCDPAISFHTCSRIIILSTLIVDYSALKGEFDILLQEKSFTMA